MSATWEREIVVPLVVRAPQLRALARLMFRVKTAEHDRRAYIQLELMKQHGLDRCPSCEARLSIDGYRETRTRFLQRESLSCRACSTTYVLHERSCA